MPDRVDAATDPVETPGLDTSLHRSPRDPHRNQLPKGDDAVLSDRNLGRTTIAGGRRED